MGEQIGYIRVSSPEQNTARQEELMRQLGINRIYIDRVSGKNTNRIELNNMLGYIRSGDTVIVESYSRFARSTKDLINLLEELERKGVKFISQKENVDTSTPQGKLMMTVFAGIAQFERECLLQRQREGIEIAKAEGRMKGRPRKEIPDFETVFLQVRNRDITIKEVCIRYNISRSKWYNLVKEYQANKEN